MKRVVISLALLLPFVVAGFAQQTAPAPPKPADQTSPPSRPADQKPSPTPQELTDLDVVKITTNLVQIDAVVVDKNGKPVTDLRPDEVEMLEDGKPQKILNFTYVNVQPPPAKSTPKKSSDNPIPEPPRPIRPEQMNRTIALVVDDLGLSFDSAYFLRRALRKFVDELMQPNDLVAIIRTAGGIGALQQFTNDKRLLYAAIEKVKWYPSGRGGISAFSPIGRPEATKPPESTPDADLEQFREEIFSVGTLGALNYVVRGLRELPGRKSVILFSDGFRIFSRSDPTGSVRILQALRVLTDIANRASVIINTVDARGLQYLGLTASDSTSRLSAQELADQLSERRMGFWDSQEGLDYLAAQTGGLAIRNTNDLSVGVRRIMEDQLGYYLIGYRPDESTFERDGGRTKFHHLSLKINRPSKYDIRMRSGFLGVTDENLKRPRETPQQQLVAALVSPFSASGVHLRLTSMFANDSKVGSVMRSYLHVRATDLTFVKDSDGSHKAVFDIIAITFGDNGTVVGQFSYTQTLRVTDSAFERTLKNGFSYNMMLPIKKPGAYQLRTALRDSMSAKVGSASQFIEVPDIKKDRLLTSGLVLSGMPLDRYTKALDSAATAPSGEGVINDWHPTANTAVRQFGTQMALLYGLVIYNAKIDKASHKTQLKLQARVFRNGELIFTGNEIPFAAGDQPDQRRLIANGAIQLGTAMAPGEYVLQVLVTDLLREDKSRIASQWIDFEVIK